MLSYCQDPQNISDLPRCSKTDPYKEVSQSDNGDTNARINNMITYILLHENLYVIFIRSLLVGTITVASDDHIPLSLVRWHSLGADCTNSLINQQA